MKRDLDVIRERVFRGDYERPYVLEEVEQKLAADMTEPDTLAPGVAWSAWVLLACAAGYIALVGVLAWKLWRATGGEQ